MPHAAAVHMEKALNLHIQSVLLKIQVWKEYTFCSESWLAFVPLCILSFWQTSEDISKENQYPLLPRVMFAHLFLTGTCQPIPYFLYRLKPWYIRFTLMLVAFFHVFPVLSKTLHAHENLYLWELFIEAPVRLEYLLEITFEKLT